MDTYWWLILLCRPATSVCISFKAHVLLKLDNKCRWLQKGLLDQFSTVCVLLALEESSERDSRSENIFFVFIMQPLSPLCVSASVTKGRAQLPHTEWTAGRGEEREPRWSEMLSRLTTSTLFYVYCMCIKSSTRKKTIKSKHLLNKHAVAEKQSPLYLSNHKYVG